MLLAAVLPAGDAAGRSLQGAFHSPLFSAAESNICLSLCLAHALIDLHAFPSAHLQVIEKESIGPADFALFAPMWLGSSLGLVTVVTVSVNVCNSSTLVSRERRLFMRAQVGV
jgi:hypothetical protein